MENKLTPELIAKAKLAKSAEELIALAKENGAQLSAEEANTYFDELNKSGELSDDELDQVAGGCTTYHNGRPVVSGLNYCNNWRCEECQKAGEDSGSCTKHSGGSFCMTCAYSRYEDALLLCYHPDRKGN